MRLTKAVSALFPLLWYITRGQYGETMTEQTADRIKIALLIWFHTVICCVSLVYLTDSTLSVAKFHIFYDPGQLANAVIAVAGFALVSIAFAFASFSFGYLTGFYFYTMISGYLWLNCFSDLNYDHARAGLSAAVSAVTFLLPALFIVSPLGQVYTMSTRAFDRFLNLILLLAGAWLRASTALLLLLLIYPITLSKLVLLGPLWLIVILLLSRFFDARATVVLSLLVPVLTGLALHLLFRKQTELYFSIVNFRLVAIPSNSLDVYNDFFSRHDQTWFCQISILKRIMACPYEEPLWTLMEKAYNLGNLNASLFATEGVASVGLLLAPLAAFGCGLVIALGNRLSAGLPPRFILLSSAMLLPILLNVPLSILLNTHGAALLFLL